VSASCKLLTVDSQLHGHNSTRPLGEACQCIPATGAEQTNTNQKCHRGDELVSLASVAHLLWICKRENRCKCMPKHAHTRRCLKSLSNLRTSFAHDISASMLSAPDNTEYTKPMAEKRLKASFSTEKNLEASFSTDGDGSNWVLAPNLFSLLLYCCCFWFLMCSAVDWLLNPS